VYDLIVKSGSKSMTMSNRDIPPTSARPNPRHGFLLVLPDVLKEQGFRAEQQLGRCKEALSLPIKDESHTLVKVAHLRKGVNP